MQFFSVVISAFALVTSLLTAWLTLFRRGTVRMTRPTVIFFGPDRGTDGDSVPKIFLRTLLFSTSKRGRVIENMHVSLTRNETRQNFSIWVYGDGRLARGSGLFIGESGIATNHHFLAPQDKNAFRFLEGSYRLEVFASLLGCKKSILLFSQQLDIQNDLGLSLKEQDAGIYFDWGPDALRYIPHLEKAPPPSMPEDMLQMIRSMNQNQAAKS